MSGHAQSDDSVAAIPRCKGCSGWGVDGEDGNGDAWRCAECDGTGSAATTFIDGNGPGCKCSAACEMPCWQRVGLTEQKCCLGCVDLPPMDEVEE